MTVQGNVCVSERHDAINAFGSQRNSSKERGCCVNADSKSDLICDRRRSDLSGRIRGASSFCNYTDSESRWKWNPFTITLLVLVTLFFFCSVQTVHSSESESRLSSASSSGTNRDIYSDALELLRKKKSRSGAPSSSSTTPSSTIIRIPNAKVRYASVDANNGNGSIYTIPPTPIKESEIDHLADEVVEATLNTPSPNSRADNGRSIDGLTSLFSRFSKVLDLGRVVKEIETSVMTSVSCTACRAGVGLLFHYVRSGRTNEEIAIAATKLCVNLKMQTPRVCAGIIGVYIDEVVEVLKGVILDSNEICALVVGETCGHQSSPALQWTVAFPPIPKPPFHGYPEPKPGAPKLKVLQISDTHWDPYYEPGSNADCGEPLCCRLSSGPLPPRSHLGAGIWGDYRKCDTPRNTMESMFEHISRTHPDIDYIIWTGDIPAHDVWNQTHHTNLEILKDTVDLFIQFFPHTPIFPALGNHEGAPVNSFAPSWVSDSRFSIDWLYDELQKEWARWLPATSFSTVKEGAYYSTLIKPGFKLISINMNYCNNKNWWLLVNSTDPVDELKWLIFELQSSELAREKVWIIGHIPPGHPDCMKTWSNNYYKIISRFEATIASQFFGHTHYDEVELFYAKEDPFRPCSIAYIGPSVTPYYNLNPGYRIYYVDGDYSATTRSVIDHETWVTDLGEANRVRASSLTWYKLYSAKQAYGLQNLSPQSWDDLVMAMYKNKRLFNMYYRFYNKNSPVAPDCDEECKTRLLCDARSGKSHAREETCRPRPTHNRFSRGGVTEAKPQSTMSQIFGSISTALLKLKLEMQLKYEILKQKIGSKIGSFSFRF